nr:immunoglobulin heavy chain junction region [Macaca mulatta]MOX38005.1 immunoglobulin heavy chain junction region [Macaca mulatta]MOX38182.1 immunoglobulin heavy chain junction region [Macaca mulatta]MOX38199.1 immunoglobulin heavy chain junction region [Macaca mulatta]MOX38275.1 immunoglobulin heavy chain junction region [Macaca mulatta]
CARDGGAWSPPFDYW